MSECWWCIETSIHVNKELLRNDTKAHIKQLQESHPNLNISIITRDLLLLSESSTASLYVETVLGRMKEYKAAEVSEAEKYGAVESCHLLPAFYDYLRAPQLETLYDYCAWSLFDQYMLFRTILMELAWKQVLDEDWSVQIVELAKEIGDWELENTLTPEQPLDQFVADVLNAYTLGNYEYVVDQIADRVAAGSPKVYGLVEVYARAQLYSSRSAGRTFFDELAVEFGRILVLDQKSSERAQYLYKVAIKFRREGWAKSLLYHLAATQEWRSGSAGVEASRLQTTCLGSYNTPKARSEQFTVDNLTSVCASLLPKHRLLRYAYNLTNDPIEPALFPIYSDYLKTRSQYLLENDCVWEALEFTIDEYQKNNVAVGFLPIRRLCERIETLSRDATFDYIVCLTAMDIYAREFDAAFDDQKSDLFLEFLSVRGTHRPSEMFPQGALKSSEVYFLRNICVPAQLDNIIEFSSYDEVIHERVAIIDLLIASKVGSSEEMRREKDKVLETLFAEKLRAKMEAGKLYVDVQALEAHRRHIYVGLYDQAKSLEGGVNLEPLSQDQAIGDTFDMVSLNEESRLAVASSEKSALLVRIFLQAIQDFALNENYGLDKYLSAEIRHIVFVTQLRSCFEKEGLVTVQKNGQYLANSYWIQKYGYVPQVLLEMIDDALGRFSLEVDTILSKVNDRFRIKSVDLQSEHIFDFCPYHSRLVRVSQIIEQSSGFDDFFRSLLAFMWELAIENAHAAQKLINDVLLAEVLAAIESLENEVNEIKGNIAMIDLMQSIRNSRSNFKNEIELVLNWFRFVGSEDDQSLERLGVIIEAAVSSFHSVFKHTSKELQFTQEKSVLLLRYSEARALFISLFTALENALRYGTSDTPVHICHSALDRVDRIIISNDIGNEIPDPDAFVASRKAEWTNEFSSLSTAEGGTGLYKIYNLLTNASPGCEVDIAIRAKQFNVIMRLHHEYFDYRRQPT